MTSIAPVAERLKQASLEPKFWQDVFHQQLGVLSLNGLKHAQCQLNLHLLQFARKMSEKIALQKFLLPTNEEITFTQHRQHQRKSLKVRNAEIQKIIEELRCALQGTRETKHFGQVLKDAFECFQLPLEFFPTQQIPTKDICDQLHMYFSIMSKLLQAEDQCVHIVKTASEGHVLRGVFLTKSLSDVCTKKQILLKEPVNICLNQPHYYQHVQSMFFKSKAEEDSFMDIANCLGYSTAISCNTGNHGIIFTLPSGKYHCVLEFPSSLSVKQKKSQAPMSETYSSLLNEYVMPLASFCFSDDQLLLSMEAINELMNTERLIGTKKEEIKKRCELFLLKFGSHAFKGPLQFGGIYKWLIQSSGYKKYQIELTEQFQQQSFYSNVVGTPIIAEEHTDLSNTISIEKSGEVKWVISRSGGPERVFGLPCWKNGLIANSATWSVIDRGTTLVPVWDIITMNHKNNFKKPFTLAIELQKAWQSMNQSSTSQCNETFPTEVQAVFKKVKLWNENRDLSKSIDVLRHVLKAKENALKVSFDPRVWPTLYLSQTPIQMCLKLISENCSKDVALMKEVKAIMRKIIDPLDLDNTIPFHPLQYIGRFLYPTEAGIVSLHLKSFEDISIYLQNLLNHVQEHLGVTKSRSTRSIAGTSDICVIITQSLANAISRFINHLKKSRQKYEEIFLTTALIPFQYDPNQLKFSSVLYICDLQKLCQEFGGQCQEFFEVLNQRLPLKTQTYLLMLAMRMCTQLAMPDHQIEPYFRRIERMLENELSPQIIDVLSKFPSKIFDCKLLESQLTPLLCNSKNHENIVERKTKLDDYFLKFGLTEFFPQKLTLRHALEVREDTFVGMFENEDRSNSSIIPKLYPFCILQKIMAFDSSCRIVLETTSELEDMPHPMDVLLSIIYCADNFLRQDLMYRLAACQLAVPLLLPDPVISQKVTYLIRSLHSIEKQWHSGTSKEGRLVDYHAPIISFLRIGKHYISKSQFINTVMSDSESLQHFFFHFDLDGGAAEAILVNGLVEVCWSLPSVNHSIFDDVVTFANLHGDARNCPKQVNFLSKVSLMTFVFIDEKSLEDSETVNVLKILSLPPGGLVLLKVDPSKKSNSFSECLKPLNPNKLQFIELHRVSAAKLKKKICTEIKNTLSEKWNVIARDSTLQNYTHVARECKIDVDEDEIHCILGKSLSTTFQNNMLEFELHNIKDILVLQEVWKHIGMGEKEQHRQKKKENIISTSKYYREQEKMIETFRSEQYSHVQNLHPLMEAFINLFQSQMRVVRNYAFQWIRCFLDDLSKERLPPLRFEYQKKKKTLYSINVKDESNESELTQEKLKEELKVLNQQIICASFGFNHLMREVSQIYEAVNSTPSAPNEMKKYVSHLPEVAAELMIDGYPLELMDGDATHVPIKWVNSVLTVLSEILHNPRLCVISILGLQSSGKSTLLNTMFGLRFRASAGRCTRGAFMQLVPIHSSLRHVANCDYFLIVDTEGLRAPELDTQLTYNHDNELATFVIGLADITVTNLFGETIGDMDDILQTAVHAFLRMKKVKITRNCHFVHQNVAEVMAKEKGMMGCYKFIEKLDEVTQAAAIEEGINDPKLRFRDVIDFDSEKGISRFPNLWKGNPPMASVNPGYSIGAQKLKIHLIEFVKEKSHSHCNELNIFQERLSELWDAVMHENFVFSFKNTLEIRAYTTLEREFGQWSWYLKMNMMEWEQEARNKLQSCDIRDVENLKRNICRQLPEYVLNIKKEVLERTSSFFETSHEKERIIQWKGNIRTRIAVLAQQLEAHAASVCEQLLTTRKAFDKVDKEKEKYRKNILKKVRHLVLNLTEKELTEEQLRDIYNEKWTGWIKKLKETSVATVDADPEGDMNEALNQFERLTPSKQLMIDQLKITSLEQRGNKLELEAREEYIEIGCKVAHYVKFFNLFQFNTPQKPESIQKLLTDGLLTQLGESVRRMETRTYHPSLATEVLHQLFEEIDKRKEESKRKEGSTVHLTKLNEVDMALTVAGYALKIFERMVASEKRKRDPVVYLEESVKERFFELFKNEYSRVAQEVTAAAAVCRLLSESIEDAVYISLGRAIVTEMRSKLSYLHTKESLKFQVFLDIGDILQKGLHPDNIMSKIEAFSHCLYYLKNPKECIREWIEKYTLKICQEGTPTTLTKNINSIIKGLVTISMKAANSVTQECRDHFKVTEWLEKFHRVLSEKGKLKLTKNELQECQGFHELKDASRFSAEVKKALKEEQHVLEKEFAKQDAKAIITKMVHKPSDIIVEQVAGCNVQCPFCKELCHYTFPNHEVKHTVSLHRPECLGGYRWIKTKQMVLDICTELVGTEKTFTNSDATKHPYKHYDTVYPKWNIPDDKSFGASRYWKWVVGKYTSEIADAFNMKTDIIDDEWSNLNWEDIKKDLLQNIA